MPAPAPAPDTPRPPVRVVSRGIVLVLLASALFFLVWYERYLSLDFNESGRHYDAEAQVVYSDSGFVWGVPAVGFLLLAAVMMARRIRLRCNGSPAGAGRD